VIESERRQGRRRLGSAGVLALTAALLTCNPCSNKILEELRSPTGRENAILFYRSCGAMGPGGFEVSVLPQGRTLARNLAGNVFDATGRPVMSWESDTVLAIAYPSETEVRFQAVRIRGVRVHYSSPSTASP
jgi:hypothetical protein